MIIKKNSKSAVFLPCFLVCATVTFPLHTVQLTNTDVYWLNLIFRQNAAQRPVWGTQSNDTDLDCWFCIHAIYCRLVGLKEFFSTSPQFIVEGFASHSLHYKWAQGGLCENEPNLQSFIGSIWVISWRHLFDCGLSLWEQLLWLKLQKTHVANIQFLSHA